MKLVSDADLPEVLTNMPKLHHLKRGGFILRENENTRINPIATDEDKLLARITAAFTFVLLLYLGFFEAALCVVRGRC